MGEWLLMHIQHKMQMELCRSQYEAYHTKRMAEAQMRSQHAQLMLIMADWHDRNIDQDARSEAAVVIAKARAIDGGSGL